MSEQAGRARRGRSFQPHDSRRRSYALFPFVILGVLIVVGVGVIIYGLQSSGGTARLQVDREEIDLGDQRLDTAVRATFQIANVGSGVLALSVPRTPTVVQGC